MEDVSSFSLIEEYNIMYDYDRQFEVLWEVEQQKNKRNLKKALSYIPKKHRDEFNNFLKECEAQNILEIVSEKNIKLKPQKEYGSFIKYIYVDQYCGISGDDWSGHVWIPLSGNKKKHRKCLKIYFNL